SLHVAGDELAAGHQGPGLAEVRLDEQLTRERAAVDAERRCETGDVMLQYRQRQRVEADAGGAHPGEERQSVARPFPAEGRLHLPLLAVADDVGAQIDLDLE